MAILDPAKLTTDGDIQLHNANTTYIMDKLVYPSPVNDG